MNCSLLLPDLTVAREEALATAPRTRPPIATTPALEALLRTGAPVAFGVSGGKDSSALVLATCAYLDSINHPRDRRIAVHADLGDIEWAASAATARAVAEHVGIECVTVRASRSMTETWESRWERNVARYAALSCVTLILPWSSARMRFCTAQTKRDPISRYLKQRFAGEVIINATGIRRQESRARAKAEIVAESMDLVAKRTRTSGVDWAPLADWLIDDVWAIHESEGFPLHEAYREYGSSRVSCAYCVLATKHDHLAALTDPRNHDVYRRVCELELSSAFAFKPKYWLSALRPDLLGSDGPARLAAAQVTASARAQLEARIPDGLRYQDGWPTRLPTPEEATLLAEIRCQVAALQRIEIGCTTGPGVQARFRELLAERVRRASTGTTRPGVVSDDPPVPSVE